MSENIYRKLQEQLDTYSLGFPRTESGIEITILKKLFNDNDAELFANLTPKIETPDVIAERLGKPVPEIAEHLESMAKRGLLFRKTNGEEKKYGAIPFMHGLLEFQVKSFDKEMAQLLEDYYDQGLRKNIAISAEYFLRTVPVDKSIETEHRVASFDDASEILEKAKSIVVADCICRKEKTVMGSGCGKDLEACFMFGSMAEYYVENNLGRRVDVDEAIQIVKSAQDAGLVTQPGSAINPMGMCNCCGDCCGVLQAIKIHPKPAELVFSNHFAKVNEDNCTGCEICIDRCQVDAIEMNDNGIAEINLDRCIGCGLCVTTCPSDAMVLVPKSDNEKRVPASNGAEQMFSLAKKRGII